MREIIIKLKAVASRLISHVDNGLCPDGANGFQGRDPDCEACQIIEEATKAQAATDYDKGEK